MVLVVQTRTNPSPLAPQDATALTRRQDAQRDSLPHSSNIKYKPEPDEEDLQADIQKRAARLQRRRRRNQHRTKSYWPVKLKRMPSRMLMVRILPPHRRLLPPRHDLNALNLKWSENIAFAPPAICPPSGSNKLQ